MAKWPLPAACTCAGATLADLDPLERERLRQNVQHYGGDRVPTLTGLLLVGRALALR